MYLNKQKRQLVQYTKKSLSSKQIYFVIVIDCIIKIKLAFWMAKMFKKYFLFIMTATFSYI